MLHLSRWNEDMDETLRASLKSKAFKRNMKTTDSINMELFPFIEAEYIKNLQKQVYLLDLETSFLRDQAKKATSIQPKLTSEAENMITQMKELQSQINNMEVELSIKETRINSVKREKESLHNNLQTFSAANLREKMVLLEDVTQLKKLAEVYTQDIAHKEEDLQKIQLDLQKTSISVKEKERDVLHLQATLQEQVKQHENVEEKLAEKRTECLRMQSLLHQLEEKYLTTAQSVQNRIGSELCKEAEKLRYQLKEKQMSADEDKYLRTKMAEDCSRLTKENGHLHSQVVEATKQLEKERQLRDEQNLNRTKRISELTSGKEKERQLELTLSHWKRLVQEERERVFSAREQMLREQKGRKSVELSGSSLKSQLADLEKRRSSLQLENSQLRVDKTHLVEHISQLHKQIADRDNEIRRMQGHVDSLCYDMNSLQLRRDVKESSQKEAWKQLSNITQSVHQLAEEMSFK
ncbi:protein CROWDED NUCLEI 3 [Xenopus laevis]|uniref:Uncharacterized protein n=2 Tax=Xenopus laevis TaxID=8355 RepID=A0A974CQI6_XENLA|nr:protein CROWDED NUCLEI 3 [Xenopus laevis]OCT76926.1 hypothetical protein XELAEV_18032130mg [Xenopus laevis]